MPLRLLCLLSLAWSSAAVGADPVPDYNRDIRPLLSNACFKCHGPGVQKSGLRLDRAADVTKAGAVVPGKPDAGTLLERIQSDDAEVRMPPPESGTELTPEQVKLLKAWIAGGAQYAPHWAFVTPTTKPQPTPGHVVDAWVDASLSKENLQRSPQADRRTLIRRASFDLIGLPPTLEEIADFVNDTKPAAYERLVDRMLASSHYGERQGRHWLDLARYADSNGYTIDGARSIWPYRDWVIDAFNRDLPYDRFTRLQLAGDLVPKLPKADLVAVGFHRNTSFNEEGGTDPEQFRVERTVDRTNTTAAVWMGLTFACAQCHDHKYDPTSRKDYFRLYAFFDNLDEPTMTVGGTLELEAKINEMTAEVNLLKTAGKIPDYQKIEAEIKKLQGTVPTTLIVRETKKRRVTHEQIRGDFLRKGGVVTPGTPSALPTKSGEALTRLDLADWLTTSEHPLTARVAVNRAWQQFFGRGLVETENDFGMQGSLPTHPELLDALAVSFREQGWSTKKLHRLIVTSESYKQASKARVDAGAIDPTNRLLARQNRLRLEAEIIRDAALTSSGLLSPKVGGPGVYPPLPSELFSFTQSKRVWKESTGPERYRRGMYTFIWRQSQHHLLTTFDGADAQTTCTKRNRSNTPLQALHLANDPAFVEFASALGKRMELFAGSPAAAIAFGFELATARKPTTAEAELLLNYHSRVDSWAAMARVLLNLDEFITRE